MAQISAVSLQLSHLGLQTISSERGKDSCWLGGCVCGAGCSELAPSIFLHVGKLTSLGARDPTELEAELENLKLCPRLQQCVKVRVDRGEEHAETARSCPALRDCDVYLLLCMLYDGFKHGNDQ